MLSKNRDPIILDCLVSCRVLSLKSLGHRVKTHEKVKAALNFQIKLLGNTLQ